MSINRVHLFLEHKGVKKPSDLLELDDIECRHIIDQIIMKSGMQHMRLSELQKSLGQSPQQSDSRNW